MTSSEPEKWIVMIYLAGNNSLGEDCVAALTQLCDANFSDNIAVFAQLNTGIHDSTTLRITNSTTIAEIQLELNAALAKRARTARQQPIQMESHKNRIFDFVSDCVNRVDANRYMLVLSGHGDGVGPFLSMDAGTSTFTVINFGQLIETINRELLDNQRLDILGLDSCLMSMTEIAYIVHNHVKVMIGAECFEPMAGWPYKEILETMSQASGNLAALSRAIVCDYINHYT